jgi:plastocyanin
LYDKPASAAPPTLSSRPFCVPEKVIVETIAIALPGVLLSSSCTDANADRTIEIHPRRFAFEPAEITAKAGETVRLRLVTDDVPPQAAG